MPCAAAELFLTPELLSYLCITQFNVNITTMSKTVVKPVFFSFFFFSFPIPQCFYFDHTPWICSKKRGRDLWNFVYNTTPFILLSWLSPKLKPFCVMHEEGCWQGERNIDIIQVIKSSILYERTGGGKNSGYCSFNVSSSNIMSWGGYVCLYKQRKSQKCRSMDNTQLHKVTRGKQESLFPWYMISGSHGRFQQKKPIRQVLLTADCRTSKELSRGGEGLLKGAHFQAVTNSLAQAKGDLSEVYN